MRKKAGRFPVVRDRHRRSMKRKINENLRRIRERMANACGRAGRDPKDVSLVAVTKYVGIDLIRQVLELGHCELGEARVQELTRRAAMIQEARARMGQGGSGRVLPEPHWHMVGHLQRNKVKHLLPWVTMIHSVDSLRLAEEISAQAERLDRTVDVLLQVNAAGESQKFGVAVGAVPHLAEQIVSLPCLRVCGLMAMAPLDEEGGRIAWTFDRVREIFADMRRESSLGPQFRHLSMGMTSDYETAIEHGATMVRIGSALFEGVVVAA